MPLQIPHITGQVSYDVEQAIEILRRHMELLQGQFAEANEKIKAMPPPLTLAEIQKQLSPTGQYPLPTASLLNTTPPPVNPPNPPPPDDGIPNYIAIVTADRNAAGIGPTSTPEECFRFVQQVALDINGSGMNPPGIVCGFVSAPAAGENVFTCAGQTYRYNRVGFSNGHLFKILEDSDPGGARIPSWDDNGFQPSLYRPATPPGSPC
jgi:hypothetical protein